MVGSQAPGLGDAVKRTPLCGTGSLKRAARIKAGWKDARRRKAKLPTNAELDRLARAVVFARDGHRCLRCHKRPPEVQIQWAHVYSRRFLKARWSVHNAMTLCAGCHFWWHDCPLDAAAWFKALAPERHMVLVQLVNGPGKVDRHAVRASLMEGSQG